MGRHGEVCRRHLARHLRLMNHRKMGKPKGPAERPQPGNNRPPASPLTAYVLTWRITPPMSQHSAGPWEVEPHGNRVLARDHKGSFPVCDIRGWGHLTGQGHGALNLPAEEAVAIQYANADLIAAAPDMLAVLKMIAASYPGYIPDFVEAVNEVIAKAEGAR